MSDDNSTPAADPHKRINELEAFVADVVRSCTYTYTPLLGDPRSQRTELGAKAATLLGLPPLSE